MRCICCAYTFIYYINATNRGKEQATHSQRWSQQSHRGLHLVIIEPALFQHRPLHGPDKFVLLPSSRSKTLSSPLARNSSDGNK
mmetsp:Transcript_21612/g.32568  ORF Transcript_21612/g.32568 Transcript_21612/m.32568 type:complete len:84 (+) Transcript_21612:947-1198(+)